VAGLLLVGAAFLYLTVWITSTRSVLQWGDDRVLRLTSHLRASPVVSDVVAGALLGSGIALGWPAAGLVAGGRHQPSFAAPHLT